MRLIDAEKLKNLRHNVIQGLVKFDGSEYDLIDKCTTIDAVPVVRCKDCYYWDAEGRGCSLFLGFGENDFCSYGERKEGAE